MSVVRFVSLLALVIWLGGMIVLGAIVAPATFGVLQSHDPATGRVLAGALFGDILRRFYLLSYVCGAVMLVCLLTMKVAGRGADGAFCRARHSSWPCWRSRRTPAIPVAREIAALQARVAGPMNSLPASDPVRTRFDTLHTLSTRLMTADIALGLVLLSWYLKD